MFDVYPDIIVIRPSKCYKSPFTRGTVNSDALMAPVARFSKDIAAALSGSGHRSGSFCSLYVCFCHARANTRALCTLITVKFMDLCGDFLWPS